MANTMSPKANIHPSASIGDNNIFEDNVIIKENCKIGNNNYFQSGSIIGPHVEIKDNNFFGSYCFIGGEAQDLDFKNEISYVRIGSYNKIREFVTVHRGTKGESATVVGDNNYMMAYAHMGHNSKIGDYNVLVNTSQLAGYSELGNRVVMSAFAAVHQFCKVGDYVMIGGGAKINKDVPPFTMVFGTPAKVVNLNIVGLRRNGFNAETREKIKDIYNLFYHSGYPFSTAIEKIASKYPEDREALQIINFFKNSKRGIIGFGRENSRD